MTNRHLYMVSSLNGESNRLMKGALEELGEEVDDDVESISKMQTHILNLTKGQVNIFKEDGESFRNIYDVYDDIVKVWDKLSETDQADLLETIAGKVLPVYTAMCA